MNAQKQPVRASMLSFPLGPIGLIRRKCACGGSPGLDGECAACRKQRLQRKAAGQTETIDVPPSVHEVLRSPGQPLDVATRAFFEPRFGHDFSAVRIHTDAKAAESAQAVNALAYTVGQDVVFGAGQHAPEANVGRRLMAHELTHVVQQAQAIAFPSRLQRSNGDGEEVDEREVEARQAEETTTAEPTGSEITPTSVRTVRLLPALELPNLRVTGVGQAEPTMYLRGTSGGLFDLRPYTGNLALDFPLAALEALGIPILSYFHFHYGRAAALRGMRFRNVYGLSGGTSFIRNAIFYGYIQAENVDLYGAPSSYSDHYDLLPSVGIHASPMDIGTMIHVDYFNNPLPDRPNNPTIILSLVAPFDQNPLEAISNLGGAIYYTLTGQLYSLPNVTHNYPEFWRRPEEQVGR